MLSAGDRLGKLVKFLLLLIVLAVIAVAVTPLNLYQDYIKQHIKPVVLSGVSGSAVKGSAQSLNYLSAPMGQAEWLLYPNSFDGVGGKLRIFKEAYDLTFNLRKLSPEIQSFHQVNGFINWSLIKPFLQMRYGQLDGYAHVDLNQVEYNKSSGLQRMEGDITLKDFKLIKPAARDLGEVKLTFKTQKTGIIVGNFSSQSNALNVSGTVYIQPRRWQLKLDIIPKAGFYELDAVLNSVGDPRRGGGRKLNLAGFY